MIILNLSYLLTASTTVIKRVIFTLFLFAETKTSIGEINKLETSHRVNMVMLKDKESEKPRTRFLYQLCHALCDLGQVLTL